MTEDYPNLTERTPVKLADTKKDFGHGDRAWTRDGVKVYVEAQTTAGLYVVMPFIDIGCFDPEEGPQEDATGIMTIVDELFAEPPRKFVDADIAAAKQELETLRDKLGDVRSEIRDSLAERTRLLTKLKEVPALQHIERMLDGKLRFVVIEMYGDPKAVTVEEAQKENDRYSTEQRLITLKTGKEGVYWAINTWRDGSGADFKIMFFETMEEAQAEVAARLSFKLDDALERYLRDDNGRKHYAGAVVEYAKKLKAAGGVIADDVAAQLIDVKREAVRQTLEAEQKNAAVHHARIEAANAELAALDAEQAT